MSRTVCNRTSAASLALPWVAGKHGRGLLARPPRSFRGNSSRSLTSPLLRKPEEGEGEGRGRRSVKVQ